MSAVPTKEIMSIFQRIREKRLRKDVKRAQAILRRINSNMKRMGWSRQRRRVFWREFSKSPHLREEIFGALTGQGK